MLNFVQHPPSVHFIDPEAFGHVDPARRGQCGHTQVSLRHRFFRLERIWARGGHVSQGDPNKSRGGGACVDVCGEELGLAKAEPSEIFGFIL